MFAAHSVYTETNWNRNSNLVDYDSRLLDVFSVVENFFEFHSKMNRESERALQNYKNKGCYVPYDSEGDLLIDVFR